MYAIILSYQVNNKDPGLKCLFHLPNYSHSSNNIIKDVSTDTKSVSATNVIKKKLNIRNKSNFVFEAQTELKVLYEHNVYISKHIWCVTI